jgi:hypothetical protein
MRKGALGRGAPFYFSETPPLAFFLPLLLMETIAIDQLTLLDLNGNPVKLSTCVANRTLLIFLRHLA